MLIPLEWEMTAFVRKHFVLPKDLADEFEHRVGERRQSEQVAALLSDWLRRERLRETLASFGESYRPEDHPEWEGEGSPEAWVREQRATPDRPIEVER